jgi:hypothetical protein
MSLHHVRMVHGSPANRSDDRRIGFAIRYIPTYVRQIAGDGTARCSCAGSTSTTTSRRVAAHRRLAPDARAHHAAVLAASAKILYRGTGVERFS